MERHDARARVLLRSLRSSVPTLVRQTLFVLSAAMLVALPRQASAQSPASASESESEPSPTSAPEPGSVEREPELEPEPDLESESEPASGSDTPAECACQIAPEDDANEPPTEANEEEVEGTELDEQDETIPPATPQEGPWRLKEVLPSWLCLSLSHRSRYEGVLNPFRAGTIGDDHIYALRTLLRGELRFDPFRLGFEVQDSRAYFGDDDTPIGSSSVNPLELLQGYLALRFEDVVTDGSQLDIRLGRLTLDIGTRRLVARNRYRNTLNAFNGLELHWQNHDGFNLHAFAVLPVKRRPASGDDARDNRILFDEEGLDTVFWGLYAGFRPVRFDVVMDTYFYGLHDQAGGRQLYTSGFSAIRRPKRGQVDFGFENAVQFGTSQLSHVTDTNGNARDLTHIAYFVHATLGYTVDVPWAPRLLVHSDYATGDYDPTDDQSNRFDTLYGARRFEYGPTGIYGAFARSNIGSPGLRFQLRPHSTISAFVGYRAYWLASGSDSWSQAKLLDASGASGSFLGHQIEARIRWNPLPGNIRLETGFAHVLGGDYRLEAPEANAGDPTVVYVQLALTI